jgi:Mn2+/Fe2+ NRAMP family transporter
MAANVGGAEKVIRIILGVALLAVGWFGVVTGGWATAAYVVANRSDVKPVCVVASVL